jgi:excisionase family DNA binding protein
MNTIGGRSAGYSVSFGLPNRWLSKKLSMWLAWPRSMRALTDLSHSRAPTVMALARALISSVAMSGTPLPRWMTTGQAAQHLGCSEATLRQWRSRGTSPRYHKPAGSRLVRYQREDLDDFLAPGSTTIKGGE